MVKPGITTNIYQRNDTYGDDGGVMAFVVRFPDIALARFVEAGVRYGMRAARACIGGKRSRYEYLDRAHTARLLGLDESPCADDDPRAWLAVAAALMRTMVTTALREFPDTPIDTLDMRPRVRLDGTGSRLEPVDTEFNRVAVPRPRFRVIDPNWKVCVSNLLGVDVLGVPEHTLATVLGTRPVERCTQAVRLNTLGRGACEVAVRSMDEHLKGEYARHIKECTLSQFNWLGDLGTMARSLLDVVSDRGASDIARALSAGEQVFITEGGIAAAMGQHAHSQRIMDAVRACTHCPGRAGATSYFRSYLKISLGVKLSRGCTSNLRPRIYARICMKAMHKRQIDTELEPRYPRPLQRSTRTT